MHKRIWNWYKTTKDIWGAIVLLVMVSVAAATIINVFVIALVDAIRNLPLTLQIALYVAIITLCILIAIGLKELWKFGRAKRLPSPQRNSDSYAPSSRAHVTQEELQLLGWINMLCLQDREDLGQFLTVSPHVNLDGIYRKESGAPHIDFDFSVPSSSIYGILVGRDVQGSVIADNIPGFLGGAPSKIPNEDGQGQIVRLNRGETKVFSLRQFITEGLRDHWAEMRAKNPKGAAGDIAIGFDCRKLYVSVDALGPERGDLQFSIGLPIESPIGSLQKVDDWDWSQYKDN